jgi:nucleoside-diphosphate-sugar epimerase
VGDVANRIIALTGGDATVAIDPKRLRPETGEVERLWCDNRRARQLLGWEPTVSLDDGLQRTIEWVSRYTQIYRPEEYSI